MTKRRCFPVFCQLRAQGKSMRPALGPPTCGLGVASRGAFLFVARGAILLACHPHHNQHDQKTKRPTDER